MIEVKKREYRNRILLSQERDLRKSFSVATQQLETTEFSEDGFIEGSQPPEETPRGPCRNEMKQIKEKYLFSKLVPVWIMTEDTH